MEVSSESITSIISCSSSLPFETFADFRTGSYYSAATPSTSRHIYSIPLPTRAKEVTLVEPIGLTNVTSPGMYKASFSPFGGFFLLSYDGPSIPWQRLIRSSDQSQSSLSSRESLF